jgi:hypothetical protein
MIKYLHLDCEMGGRDLKYSLLTSFFLVTDENFNILDSLELATKPDDNDYIVTAQGMSVNKIDLVEHDKNAISYKQAKTKLYNFLDKNSNLGQERLTPVGHGVRGDIEHITDKLISIGSWEKCCTYHYIDTSVVLQYLRACGKLPMHIDGSVSGLANYFDLLKVDYFDVLKIDNKKWHSAEFDTLMTMMVYQKMVELGKS